MKSLGIIGLLLIILGIGGLTYSGFTYTKTEKIAEVGDVKLTADTKKRVNVPPELGGLLLVVGLILVGIERFGRRY